MSAQDRSYTISKKVLARNLAQRKADPDEVVSLIGEGFSQAEVARRVGLTRERVRQICAEHGVEAVCGWHNYDLRDAVVNHGGRTAAEIAKKIGVHIQSVHFTARAEGVKLRRPPKPKPTVDAIRDLAAQGLTVGEVAQRLGISQPRVSAAKKREGIQFARDGRSRPLPSQTGAA